MKSRCAFHLTILGVVCLSVFSGCTNEVNSKLKAANATNLHKLANAFKLFANLHNYQGPKSADELKEFLKTHQSIAKNLEIMGLDRDNLDPYFVSSVDGEPFVVRWGIKLKRQGGKEPIVFDKKGLNGIRRVMLANGTLLNVDDEVEYKELLEGKVKNLGGEPEI